LFIAGVALAASGSPHPHVAQAHPAAQCAFEPKADALLRKMSTDLAGMTAFRFNTDHVMEVVTRQGEKIQSVAESTVWVQRPNKLRADRMGPLGGATVYYDGSKLSIYGKRDNLYATTKAPDDLDGMIDFPLQAALADFVSGLHPDFAGRLDNETLETVLSGGAGVVGLARTDPDGWAVRALHRVLSADALFTNQWSDALQLLAVLSSHDDAGHLAGDLRHRPGAVEEDLVARVRRGIFGPSRRCETQ